MNVGPSRTAPAPGSLDVVLPARLPLARPYPGVREPSSSLPRARTMPRREAQRTSSEKLGTRGGQGFRSSTFNSRSTSGRPTAPKIRIGVELSSSSCPRLELSSLSTSSMARSTSVGALLLRAVGDRLPISDPASHAAIRRRELLEETRTLFASATVCSRGGKGLRGGCPPISALLEMPSSASRYSVLLL